MDWTFTFDGHVFRKGDVTVKQYADIQDALDGKSWLLVNPILSAQDARQVFRVVVGDHSENLDRDGALAVIDVMTADEFAELFKVDEDDGLPTQYTNGIPPQGGDPMTSGSSGAPDDSGGPLT